MVNLNQTNQKIKGFFTSVSNKLKNFKNFTIGEQISFGSMGLGLILILFSIVLFII